MIDKVVVCGVPYTVTLILGLHGVDGREYYGRVDHQQLAIDIEEMQADVVQVQALVHEAMHALLHQTGHLDIDEVVEERIVALLGCQLPGFLRANPELVRMIMSE